MSIILQSSLLSLQNLLFNEHNKIADALHEVFKAKVSFTDQFRIIYIEFKAYQI